MQLYKKIHLFVIYLESYGFCYIFEKKIISWLYKFLKHFTLVLFITLARYTNQNANKLSTCMIDNFLHLKLTAA